ncbi:hypothetical protein L873DRAFT_1803552 [Choiromyces venosus 120613-1]|uniref:Uncharacterized protein n=1 Tax=Choiromyces venosus 120613-1 TaxID=1336337 RepID=A0A3N4JX36_9PEZI|nr:hypothetical protein L873DRAFT_1803552 [Choiromyces venosus 120613-1]
MIFLTSKRVFTLTTFWRGKRFTSGNVRATDYLLSRTKLITMAKRKASTRNLSLAMIHGLHSGPKSLVCELVAVKAVRHSGSCGWMQRSSKIFRWLGL